MAHGHPATRVPKARPRPPLGKAPHVGVWLVLLMPGAAKAGDLEPPGPPAPTMKTLQQIEPRVPIDLGVENNVVVRNFASCNTSNYDSGANTLATIGTNPWGNLSMTGFCP